MRKVEAWVARRTNEEHVLPVPDRQTVELASEGGRRFKRFLPSHEIVTRVLIRVVKRLGRGKTRRGSKVANPCFKG